MTISPNLQAHLGAALLGLSTYTFYYHHGEHHLFPHRHLQALVCLFTFLLLSQRLLNPTLPLSSSLQAATTLTTTYLVSIFTGLTTYRLLLNPLNKKFPGIPLSRLSHLSLTLRVAGPKNLYRQLHTLHRAHASKFIRTGPNDLSVSDAAVVRVALSGNSKFIKAPWYSTTHPFYSLFTARVRASHDPRRRVWSPAFSERALRGYELRLKQYNDALVKVFEGFATDGDGQSKSKSVNVTDWFNYWSFDVMGDLAFGRSFQMLQSASGHWVIDLLTSAQVVLGMVVPPWLSRFLFLCVPGAQKRTMRFIEYAAEQMRGRMAVQGEQSSEPDITHFLIEDFNSRFGVSTGEGRKEKGAVSRGEERETALRRLYFESRLVIIAGSDTTSSAMVFLFYHIAKEEGLLRRLREEIEGLVAGGEIDARTIQAAPLLNACINETLRLHPVVPSGVYRKAPPEGAFVGEIWIPGDTTVLVNFYAMGRGMYRPLSPSERKKLKYGFFM